MSEISELERQLAVLEGRFAQFEKQNQTTPKGFWARLVSWDLARNLVWVIGVPALIVSAWQFMDQQVINASETRKAEARAVALVKMKELQDYQSDILVLQAQDKSDVAFARLEATRGQYERLARDLYTLWSQDPAMFWTSELINLTEALLQTKRTDLALDVVKSVPLEDEREIENIDLNILKARVLFSRGPAQDAEAARDALRSAVAISGDITDLGVQATMNEKIVSVRVINELWLGTPCDNVSDMVDFLKGMASDGVPEEAKDPVRRNTEFILSVHDQQCDQT